MGGVRALSELVGDLVVTSKSKKYYKELPEFQWCDQELLHIIGVALRENPIPIPVNQLSSRKFFS
jgi:hypothetical protein